MNKLITYGCSLTYGEGLKDCYVPATKRYKGKVGPYHLEIPSRFSWPNWVAKELEISVTNYGHPGASNKFILNKILETEYFNSKDIVVVLWTFFNRSCMFDDDSVFRLIPTDLRNNSINHLIQKKVKIWYNNFFFNKDRLFESYICINHAKLYLDKLNIKNYHFILDQEYNNYIPPRWNSVELNKIKFDFTLGFAADNSHPGIQSHIDVADKMLKVIKA